MYRVRNWSQFQHYKKRNPPWIKLHFELLSSRDWVMLDDASRLLAIACMLVASRHNGEVPDDPEYIRRVAHLDRVPNLKPLIKCGFIESQAFACKPLANACAIDREETERESETQTEGWARPSKRCPSDFVVTEDLLAWAAIEAISQEVLQSETPKFKDYTFASSRSDWKATWRNWMRKARDSKANGASNGRKESAAELLGRSTKASYYGSTD